VRKKWAWQRVADGRVGKFQLNAHMPKTEAANKQQQRTTTTNNAATTTEKPKPKQQQQIERRNWGKRIPGYRTSSLW